MKILYAILIIICVSSRLADSCTPADTSYPRTVTVKNYGAYIARYTLTYITNGQQFRHETELFLAFQEKTYRIPPYSSRIRIKVENMIFIFIWKTVYEMNLEPWSDFCLSIGGTTLDPSMNSC